MLALVFYDFTTPLGYTIVFGVSEVDLVKMTGSTAEFVMEFRWNCLSIV